MGALTYHVKVEKDGVAHLFLDSASSAKRGKDDFDDLLDFAPAISAGGAGVYRTCYTHVTCLFQVFQI